MEAATHRKRCRRSGLSLVEVLVAVGICATTVVVAVALFGPVVRATRETADRRLAVRLARLVETELRRGGFAAVAEATAGGATLELVGRGDVAQVVLLADADRDPADGVPRGIPAAERYFRIEVARALRPDSTPACLVLQVRVSWPLALPPDGAIVAESQRSEFLFHTALNR